VDPNKELQIKDGRKITALVKVKNALHSITKEQWLSIKRGGEGHLVWVSKSWAETGRKGGEVEGRQSGRVEMSSSAG
jgi:hypothetical protein